jgi:hypothetical protein
MSVDSTNCRVDTTFARHSSVRRKLLWFNRIGEAVLGRCRAMRDEPACKDTTFSPRHPPLPGQNKASDSMPRWPNEPAGLEPPHSCSLRRHAATIHPPQTGSPRGQSTHGKTGTTASRPRTDWSCGRGWPRSKASTAWSGSNKSGDSTQHDQPGGDQPRGAKRPAAGGCPLTAG